MEVFGTELAVLAETLSYTKNANKIWGAINDSTKQAMSMKRYIPGASLEYEISIAGLCKRSFSCNENPVSGVEYEGPEIGDLLLVDSTEACATECEAVDECRVWSFAAGLCFLKASKDNTVVSPDVTSGECVAQEGIKNVTLRDSHGMHHETNRANAFLKYAILYKSLVYEKNLQRGRGGA